MHVARGKAQKAGNRGGEGPKCARQGADALREIVRGKMIWQRLDLVVIHRYDTIILVVK